MYVRGIVVTETRIERHRQFSRKPGRTDHERANHRPSRGRRHPRRGRWQEAEDTRHHKQRNQVHAHDADGCYDAEFFKDLRA